jgi:hypothetical protein
MGPEFRVKDLRFYIDGKELTGNITGPIKVKVKKAPVWKRIRAKIKKLFKKGIKTGTASFTLWKDKKTSKKKLITIDELIAEEKAKSARKAMQKYFASMCKQLHISTNLFEDKFFK